MLTGAHCQMLHFNNPSRACKEEEGGWYLSFEDIPQTKMLLQHFEIIKKKPQCSSSCSDDDFSCCSLVDAVQQLPYGGHNVNKQDEERVTDGGGR